MQIEGQKKRGGEQKCMKEKMKGQKHLEHKENMKVATIVLIQSTLNFTASHHKGELYDQ